MSKTTNKISVVTPTLRRPDEVEGLLANLSNQSLLPFEVILVDGAPPAEKATEHVVTGLVSSLPFHCTYVRHGGGTAIQRNVGIEAARGDFIAFIDDDVRLDPNFFQIITTVFEQDTAQKVGGVVGYRTNSHFKLQEMPRWRWYKKLRLLSTYEPGRYDFQCGYPINANMQPAFSGVREVDFMTTACAVWRHEVFARGLRFDPFFKDYGVLEDAHLSLKAGRQWRLLQCGDAHCVELSSPRSRENGLQIGYKVVVNYYYVFKDISGGLSWGQRLRFWRYQAFELFRISISVARRRRRRDLLELKGRLAGITAIASGNAYPENSEKAYHKQYSPE